MKRIIAMILTVAILTFLPVPVEAAAASYNITVKFTAVKKVSNNHVGNSWDHVVKIGTTSLSVNKSAKYVKKSTDKITFLCQSKEKDSSPDIGSISTTVSVSSLKTGTTSYIKNVTVIENKGRYKGNKAIWKYTVTITKKKK